MSAMSSRPTAWRVRWTASRAPLKPAPTIAIDGAFTSFLAQTTMAPPSRGRAEPCAAAPAGEPRQRRLERLALLGEAEADVALDVALAVERGNRHRRHAGLQGQAAAEFGVVVGDVEA